MSEVAHVGHAELLTPDLGASREFFVAVMGMTIVSQDARAIHLRGYGQYQLTDLKLTAGPAAGLGHLALRVRSRDALQRLAAELEGRGCGLGWHQGDVGHGPAYRFTDPTGHLLELYWEVDRPGRREPRGDRESASSGWTT